MEEFDFDYHSVSTDYPETTGRMVLGNSYQYSPAPTAPPQRVFTLAYDDAAMSYFPAASGTGVDADINPSRNMARLEAFYSRHEQWNTFIYNHPIYGAINCKFNKGLQVPKAIAGKFGAISSFTLEFQEQP